MDGKSQVHAIRPDGGEAQVLSKHDASIGNHAWSPDGASIVFTAPEGDDPAAKARKEAYGEFTVVQPRLPLRAGVDARRRRRAGAPAKGRQRTRGTERHVQGFDVSPDGTRVAFAATRTPDLVDGGSADIFVLDLAGDTVRPLVVQPGPDTGPVWSPDGTRLAFGSAMREPRYFHANGRVAVVDAAGGTPVSVTDTFDEDPQLVAWTPTGLYVSGLQKTASHLFRVDPEARTLTRVSSPDALMLQSASFSADGRTVAFIAGTASTLPEVHVSDVTTFAPRVLTTRSTRLRDWTLATREVISWKSQDGETIEGVLIKPRDFDPPKKYPLLCVIHGGPTGIDRPQAHRRALLPGRPLGRARRARAQGELPRQRRLRPAVPAAERAQSRRRRRLGCALGHRCADREGHGRSEAARVHGLEPGRLHLGVPDHVDDRFKAISVGAGISNWATYYYNTDITPFTIQYLGADPADDPEIYRKTSPMTYVNRREDADADPARRVRPSRADRQRVRTASGPARIAACPWRWSSTRASVTASRSPRRCGP